MNNFRLLTLIKLIWIKNLLSQNHCLTSTISLVCLLILKYIDIVLSIVIGIDTQSILLLLAPSKLSINQYKMFSYQKDVRELLPGC